MLRALLALAWTASLRSVESCRDSLTGGVSCRNKSCTKVFSSSLRFWHPQAQLALPQLSRFQRRFSRQLQGQILTNTSKKRLEPAVKVWSVNPLRRLAALLVAFNIEAASFNCPTSTKQAAASELEWLHARVSTIIMDDEDDEDGELYDVNSRLVLPSAVKEIVWAESMTPKSIWLTGEIDHDMSSKFVRKFSSLANSGQEVVPIFINSDGGSVYDALQMVDVMRTSAVPIATIVSGRAFSAATLLMSCGWEGLRYISPTATAMIHAASHDPGWGKTNDIMVEALETERLDTLTNEIMDQNCGKPKGYFSGLCANVKRTGADVYLTAEDCLHHGLANHIGMPHFETEISMTSRLIVPNSSKVLPRIPRSPNAAGWVGEPQEDDDDDDGDDDYREDYGNNNDEQADSDEEDDDDDDNPLFARQRRRKRRKRQ